MLLLFLFLPLHFDVYAFLYLCWLTVFYGFTVFIALMFLCVLYLCWLGCVMWESFDMLCCKTVNRVLSWTEATSFQSSPAWYGNEVKLNLNFINKSDILTCLLPKSVRMRPFSPWMQSGSCLELTSSWDEPRLDISWFSWPEFSCNKKRGKYTISRRTTLRV